ncbi:MAG: retroviral-like aspartic protease family protein [Sphingobium sp.]|nr:retroviral-like aspartic protease family protein [Sphingobium sp.]MBP8669829.1 retroviral-like aspartic protease family protein [Sphingobium sp.]MBP9156411.1 retroviral-like aspartic protease family protein [Sphingobium sp.]MCC6483083.1 retroviral-like aspartic protease family protein [Sphingomonadaceae bacterium]
MMASACAAMAAMVPGFMMPLMASPAAPSSAPATVMASYVEQHEAPDNGASVAGKHILPAPDGLYYLDADFKDGKRARFLIDTGASVTVLTGEDARRLGVVAEDAANGGARLRTAGGMMVARSATIARMDIVGRQLRNIKVAIIDNGLPVSLLGQNALTELGTITLGNGRMTID